MAREAMELLVMQQFEQLKSVLPDKPVADIAEVAANMLGQALPMDGGSAKSVREYMANMLTMFNDKIDKE